MQTPQTPRVLFISNGHGEDNHASYIVRALRGAAPGIEISALPIVGLGGAYRALDVPIVGPTMDLPSGGFTYHNRLRLLGDVRAGLVGLSLRQFRAARREGRRHDLVIAVGDSVASAFALASGLPYIQFISPLTALFGQRFRLDALLRHSVHHRRCLALYTRDRVTCEELRRQGYPKVELCGIPALDFLAPGDVDLKLEPGRPVVGLLPGSRIPEAERNFRLMLQFVEIDATRPGPAPQYRAALVPRLQERLDALAPAGWRREGDWLKGPNGAEVMCPPNAFADVLNAATCVVGMAGLAIAQAAGLGKAVLTFAGEGPQFNPIFAEAETRLLGAAGVHVGDGRPASTRTLDAASTRLRQMLADPGFLARAAQAGRERLGARGGADRIARRALREPAGEGGATTWTNDVTLPH